MLSTAHAIKARLQRKFYVSFSVTSGVTENGVTGIRIRWSGAPSTLDVSLALRDFRETKHYFKRWSTALPYLVTTEKHQTPSQLRMA